MTTPHPERNAAVNASTHHEPAITEHVSPGPLDPRVVQWRCGLIVAPTGERAEELRAVLRTIGEQITRSMLDPVAVAGFTPLMESAGQGMRELGRKLRAAIARSSSRYERRHPARELTPAQRHRERRHQRRVAACKLRRLRAEVRADRRRDRRRARAAARYRQQALMPTGRLIQRRRGVTE